MPLARENEALGPPTELSARVLSCSDQLKAPWSVPGLTPPQLYPNDTALHKLAEKALREDMNSIPSSNIQCTLPQLLVISEVRPV